MAFVLKDRVKESTTSAGTGAIDLGGAAATFDTFQSVLTDGSTTYYAIVHASSGVDEWEIGLGTWNTGNTLTRTAVLAGSNGTSPVDFSAGIKDIFMTYPASKAIYQNADSSVSLPDGLSVMGIIDGATSLEVETHIDLNTTDLTKPAHREGRIFYDEEYGALAVYNGESDITLQVGQEEWILVYNGTGSAITDGTPVYATGAVGEAISIAPADATTEEMARVIGLATHTIEASTQGYVTVRGLVSGIDTSSLTPGQPIHLSPSGGLQNVAPTYPYYPTDLGYCISSDASNGYVYVQPTLHTYEQFRVTGNQHVDGNLTVDGDLTITGTQSVVSQASLAVDDSFIYLNSGDTIGAANTAFSGSGLDDATLTGHYSGTTSETYYVRIDGVGTGTGGVDTFEWSLDNFSTTEATGVDCTTTDTTLSGGISVRFNATTGHTSGDTWSGTAAPINVDSGTFANRNTGASGVGYTHMGWFFDVSANKFVFLEAYDPEPEGTIDLGDASVTYATLKAGSFEGDLHGNVTGDVSGDVSGTLTGNSTGTHTGPVVGNVTGSVTGNASTATKLATARTVQLSGDVVGSASFDGSANINITASVQDDSHAHVISNVDGLQAALDAKADDTTTITAGPGLTGGGSIGVNRTISHADTSTQASVDNSGATFIQDVTVDTYGHVTGLGSKTLTAADVGAITGNQTITLSGDVSGSGTTSISVTVADDSHNHIIANVDGLQAALDGKLSTSGKAADSNLLDGIDSTRFVYGSNQYATSDGRTDINGLVKTGHYWASSATNKPSTENGTVMHINHDGGTQYASQLFSAHDGALNSYIRSKNVGSWNSWQKIWTSSNDGSGSGLDADLLDGQHGSYYYPASNPNGYTTNVGDITGVTAGNGLTGGGASGSVTISMSGSYTGNFTASGDVTAFSDERLKSNVKTIDSALEKVQNLRGVTFDKDGREGLGVIAQDVQAVIPQVVIENEEYLSVAYGNMVGLLIEAIKEQQVQIEELKAKLE